MPTHGPGASECWDASKVGPWVHTPHLLGAGEGVVEAGNIGHDGFLVGLWGVHDVWGKAVRCLLAKTRGGKWAQVPTQVETSLGMGGADNIWSWLPTASYLKPSSSSLKPRLITPGPSSLPLCRARKP